MCGLFYCLKAILGRSSVAPGPPFCLLGKPWLVCVFLPSGHICFCFSSGTPHLLFLLSVQHQGRLSLDLSHRACSDYSEMRATHGSNSLPSSARLGNCTIWTLCCRGCQAFHLCLHPDVQICGWAPHTSSCHLLGLSSFPYWEGLLPSRASDAHAAVRAIVFAFCFLWGPYGHSGDCSARSLAPCP